MKVIILAAGYATRLYPLTLDKPKALLQIAGKPILDYILDGVNGLPAGVADAVYVVSNDKFYRHFSDWAETAQTPLPVTVLNDGTTEEGSRRGAIGDIAFCLEQMGVDDEVLIIAGDNFFTFSLSHYYNFYREKNGDCVCAKELNDPGKLSQFAVASVDENGRITDLVEKPAQPKSNLAVYASYFYTRETLPLFKTYLDEGNKPDAPGYFPEWLYKRKSVYAYPVNGDCYDIGTPEMYEQVNNLFKK